MLPVFIAGNNDKSFTHAATKHISIKMNQFDFHNGKLVYGCLFLVPGKRKQHSLELALQVWWKDALFNC